MDDDSDALFQKNTKAFYDEFKDYVSQIEDAASKDSLPLIEKHLEEYFNNLFGKNPSNKEEEDKFKNYMIEMLKLQDFDEKFKNDKEKMNIY